MDLQHVLIAMAAALERKRKEKRRMKMLLRALRQKAKHCEMLKKKKQNMLAEEAPKEKMVHDFMLYIEAIDRNDTETVQKFDESSMMIAIRSMVEAGGGGGGHNGGFPADGGEKDTTGVVTVA